MELSRNCKTFAEFFSQSPEIWENFEYSEEKMSLRGDMFLKLKTAKSEVT